MLAEVIHKGITTNSMLSYHALYILIILKMIIILARKRHKKSVQSGKIVVWRIVSSNILVYYQNALINGVGMNSNECVGVRWVWM